MTSTPLRARFDAQRACCADWLYVPGMSDIVTDLLKQLPIDQIAAHVGASSDEVKDAIAVGAPAMLQGISANAASNEGASALLGALAKDHDAVTLEDTDVLGQTNLDDGQKIVQHIFGSNTDAVAGRLGVAETNKASSSLFTKILPLIAPLVMGWLAKRLAGDNSKGGGAGGLGDLLGGLVGGDAGNAQGQSGGGLGDMLGGLLGGSGGDAGGPDLGSILGGGSSGGGLGDLIGGLIGGAGNGGPQIPDIGDLLGGGS